MNFITLYYKVAYKYNPKNDILWKEIARYLKKYIKNTDRVLDLGAGYCYFINNLECNSKVAIDIYPEFKKFANNTVQAHVISYEELDSCFRSEFDIVFASNFFEHLTMGECHDCLKKISSVLKPMGSLIIIQPNFRYCFRQYFDDYTHKTVFDDVSMCQLLRDKQFEPIIVEPKFMPYTTRKKNYFINKYLIRFYLCLPFKFYSGQMFILAKSVKRRLD